MSDKRLEIMKTTAHPFSDKHLRILGSRIHHVFELSHFEVIFILFLFYFLLLLVQLGELNRGEMMC